MIIHVRVCTRSSKNEIIEMPDKSLKIKLSATPIKGKANEALIKLLSKYFNVTKNQIKIKSGLTSRNKILEIL